MKFNTKARLDNHWFPKTDIQQARENVNRIEQHRVRVQKIVRLIKEDPEGLAELIIEIMDDANAGRQISNHFVPMGGGQS